MKKKILFLVTLICLLLLASFFVYKTIKINKLAKTVNSFKNEELLYDEDNREYQIEEILIDYSFHPYYDTNTGIYFMKGNIKNTGKSTIYNLRITVDFYDQDLNKIDSFIVKAGKVGAGKTISVDQRYGKSKTMVYTFKISDVKGYRR